MAKKKKKPVSKASKKPSLRSGGELIENIKGAKFDPKHDDLEMLQELIDNGVNKDLEEIRVLFISEASYLHTGFATYTREVLNRLHSLPNMTVAELGSYGGDVDPRVKSVPWKFYGNLPVGKEQQDAYQANYKDNQFGLFKFAAVMSDFEPDVVLIHRDHWMDRFVVDHQVSKKCHVIWMACVDSYPQRWEWLKDYGKADTLMAYSHFGKKVMEDQSRSSLANRHKIPPLNVQRVAQAGTDPSVFRPLDKSETKTKWGLNPDVKIIGSVMRNQPRKLFSRLIDSYGKFLDKYPETGALSALLLHTGIPDVGFDIPESVFRNGLEHRVLFTHICHTCDAKGVSPWGFTNRPCDSCGKQTVSTPNTNKGYDEEAFNEVYNLMDLYVQASICEGDGMPATEAKSCGVPVTCTDYSALYEKNRNGGAIPLKVQTMYTEAETMQNRALFSVNSLVENMNKVLSSDFYAATLSSEGRNLAVEHYGWDLAAKKWQSAILNADLKGRSVWEKPNLTLVVVSNGDEASDQGTLYNLSSNYHVDAVLVDGGDDRDSNIKEAAKGGWVFLVESGEFVYNLNPGNLLNELFYHGEDKVDFHVLKLNAEVGGIDTSVELFENRLFHPELGKSRDESPLMITTGAQEAQTFLKHREIVRNIDLSSDQGIFNLRVAQTDGAETIRKHVKGGQLYIVDSHKPITFSMPTPTDPTTNKEEADVK
jgi:glycosyltransferase involved in cell wall biosynthesis